MRRNSTLIGAGMVAIAIFTVTACGSGEGDGPTRSQFLEKGNAICRETKSQIRRATSGGQAIGRPSSKQDLDRLARTVLIPHLEQQVQKLRRLQAPASDRDAVRRLTDSLQAAVSQSRRKPITFGPAIASPYAQP
jgi:hypothetical protein